MEIAVSVILALIGCGATGASTSMEQIMRIIGYKKCESGSAAYTNVLSVMRKMQVTSRTFNYRPRTEKDKTTPKVVFEYALSSFLEREVPTKEYVSIEMYEFRKLAEIAKRDGNKLKLNDILCLYLVIKDGMTKYPIGAASKDIVGFGCWRGMRGICTKTGLSKDSIQTYTSQMSEMGLFFRKSTEYDFGTTLYLSNQSPELYNLINSQYKLKNPQARGYEKNQEDRNKRLKGRDNGRMYLKRDKVGREMGF